MSSHQPKKCFEIYSIKIDYHHFQSVEDIIRLFKSKMFYPCSLVFYLLPTSFFPLCLYDDSEVYGHQEVKIWRFSYQIGKLWRNIEAEIHSNTNLKFWISKVLEIFIDRGINTICNREFLWMISTVQNDKLLIWKISFENQEKFFVYQFSFWSIFKIS